MPHKTCIVCNTNKSLNAFHMDPRRRDGYVSRCKSCILIRQKELRRLNGNKNTRRYEKTKKGFLVRAYRNMLSRVTGIQRRKFHLYVGLEILSRPQFYEWALGDIKFHQLFSAWENSGYDQSLAPSVDRIESSKGYSLSNIQWLTNSENSAKGSEERWAG